jgi:cystathionine beta-lyase
MDYQTSAINFDLDLDRLNSDSAKWSYYPPDALPMWVADMDFLSPSPVIEALHKRAEHGVFGYGSESKRLRTILCERMYNRYDWKITPEDIVFLPGLVCGLNVVARAIGNPGDGVLVNTPVYPPFLSAPTNQGRLTHVAEQTPTLVDGHLRYEVDFDAFTDAIQPNTRLFILCNPHNPTGRIYSAAELARMAEVCAQHDLVICSDEIHCDLILNNARHLPIASLAPEIAQRTITLMAPSKTFNVPGLGCSFAIVQNSELRKRLQTTAGGIVPHVNVMGMTAAEAAYGDPASEAWLQTLVGYLRQNRDFLVNYIGRHLPNLRTTVPEATYLAWIDCRQTGIEGNPQQFLLNQGRVAFNDGKLFGQGGEGFVRINFGCPRATLREGLTRLRTALARVSAP